MLLFSSLAGASVVGLSWTTIKTAIILSHFPCELSEPILLYPSSRNLSRKLWNHTSANGVRTVIPYAANQRWREKRLLRVDRYFRTHGPARDKRTHRRKATVERMNSRLKASEPKQTQDQRSQKHHHSCPALHDRHAHHSTGRSNVGTSGKSQIHDPTRKLSRNWHKGVL